MDVNPFMTGSEFHPDGVYRINIDADGDAHADATFTGKNVLSIVLEVPKHTFGDVSVIGVWATVSVRRDGTLVQTDLGGHPTLSPFLNPDDAKDLYNPRQPADDAANYLQPWSQL